MVNVAVVGCSHGELDSIFDLVRYLIEQKNIRIDLIICCGDFQAVRNRRELCSMAVPQKFRRLADFHRYYSGQLQAPVLTIFVGGNHEASSYLAELPYGGWVAPKIFYLGIAGVISVCGLRIAGLSGIYKRHDYHKGHFECPPFSQDTLRSVYHTRNVDVFRLKQLRQPVDVFFSHDWPLGIHRYGDHERLFARKPFLRDDANKNELGSPPGAELLGKLQPRYWFAAHLHVKFAAFCDHGNGRLTQFLALDKCLPHRAFLQVVDIPTTGQQELPAKLHYDLEWLAVLRQTDCLTSVERGFNFMPTPKNEDEFCASEELCAEIREALPDDLVISESLFVKTAPTEQELGPYTETPPFYLNPQTTTFCARVGVTDIPSLLSKRAFTADTSNGGNADAPRDSSSIFDSFLSTVTTSEPSAADLDLDPDEISLDCLDDNVPQRVDEEHGAEEKEMCFSGLKREVAPEDVPVMLKRRNQTIYSETNETDNDVN